MREASEEAAVEAARKLAPSVAECNGNLPDLCLALAVDVASPDDLDPAVFDHAREVTMRHWPPTAKSRLLRRMGAQVRAYIDVMQIIRAQLDPPESDLFGASIPDDYAVRSEEYIDASAGGDL